MKTLLIIGSGGFAGAICRYLLAAYVQSRFLSSFPFGTLVVNIAGCLLIGCLMGLIDRGMVSPHWRLFLVTGCLGGFTTFSAFSIETVNLARDGQWLFAASYVFASVALGIGAAFAGYLFTRTI